MTLEDVAVVDEAWFEQHRGANQYVRHAFDGEREQVIAPDPSSGIGPVVVLVTQIKPGRVSLRMMCMPDDEMANYVVRNGPDCIGIQQGEPYLLIPGSVVNGRVLQ